jgi:hypothetical protein
MGAVFNLSWGGHQKSHHPAFPPFLPNLSILSPPNNFFPTFRLSFLTVFISSCLATFHFFISPQFPIPILPSFQLHFPNLGAGSKDVSTPSVMASAVALAVALAKIYNKVDAKKFYLDSK